MISGILYTILACFCWSLVFVIPSLIKEFSPIEIALCRFFFYGLISFTVVLVKKRHFFSKSYLPLWKTGFLFAFLSTILCYTGSIYNIKYAGPTIATLVFSMVPITITLAGNWHKRECSFKKLLLPLALMIAGIILAKASSLESKAESLSFFLIGISCGLVGLASWTVFTVLNSDFLQKQKTLSLNDWGLLTGTATFFLVLIVSSILACFGKDFSKYSFSHTPFNQFLSLTFLLGTVSTWLSFFLWNKGSKKLPVSLTGQLMIFEILFALILIYLFENKAPTSLEITGICLMITGVLTGFKVVKKSVELAPKSEAL